MKIRTFFIAIALLATAASAHAQDRTLERIQNMIATGRLTEARNTLTEWERENSKPGSTATSDDRARALYLVGALSTDADAAEDAFIGVVLSYPSSPVAAEALLRLGQGLYTAGDNERAIMYLERLRSDYPGSPERQTGLLWLARAQLASGDAAIACGTARQSLFGTTNENVRTLIEIERDRACTASGGVATNPPGANAVPRRRADTGQVTTLDPDSTLRTGMNPPVTGAQPAANAEPRANAEPPANAAPPANAQPPADTRNASAQRAAEVATSPVRRANPLPDLGIAVDANVREPETPAPPQRAEPVNERRDANQPQQTNERTPADRASTERTGAERAGADAPRTEPTVDGPEYAVQTAAFSELRPAQTIAAELRAKGFDARIVQVPGSPYYRVRYGAYATSRDAAAAALTIRDAGFATLIVNDVRLEQRL